MESPDRASHDQPSLAGASLEEGISVVSSPNVEKVGEGPPLIRVVITLVPPPKPTGTGPSKKQLLNQILLSTYVPPLERVHPLTGMVAPDPKGLLEIVLRWILFNQEESPVVHMRDLYPNYFRIPMVAQSKRNTIPLPIYMDKDAFQPMAEDGMLIRNHDFHRSTELVCVDF